jgi:hypothetical protein
MRATARASSLFGLGTTENLTCLPVDGTVGIEKK